MFCPNCGTKVEDNAAFCYKCGGVLKKSAPPAQPPTYSPPPAKPADEKNIVALIGFILAFVVPIAGIVCSAIGLNNARENGGVKKGFAQAGLIVGIVETVLSIIAVIVTFTLIGTMFSYLDSHGLFRYIEDAVTVASAI